MCWPGPGAYLHDSPAAPRVLAPDSVWERILEQPRVGRGLEAAISIKLRKGNYLYQRLFGERVFSGLQWVKSFFPTHLNLNKSNFY